jgi:hypothetical protein
MMIDRFSQYNWQIGLTFVGSQKLTSEAFQDQLLKLTQLTSLEYYGKMPYDPNDSTNWFRLTILTNLQNLGLGSQRQTFIPYGLLYYYTNLTSISGINVEGITDDSADLLKHCTKLQSLKLTGAYENAPKISHLTNLTYLDYWQQYFQINVSSLVNLRYLAAHSANIGNLTKLEGLLVYRDITGDISRNKHLTNFSLDLVTNAKHATALTSLNSLRMATVTLRSDLDDIINLSNNEVLLMMPQTLTYLEVSLGGPFNMQSITHLTNLLTLEASAAEEPCRVMPEDFKSFSRLTSLSVGETFNSIKYLPNLREFSNWIGTLEDGSTLDDFDPTFLPNLESLSISRHLTTPVFNRLSALRSLKDISIHLDATHKFDFNVFSYMALERMNLDAKYMTAECWQSLAQLTKLTALAIDTDEISEHVTYLAGLTDLQRLYLSVKQTVPAQYFLERRFTQVLFLSVYPVLRITPDAYSNNFPNLRYHNFDLLQA